MMERIGEWILGITCASVLLAAAQCLMPKGSVRSVGRLAGGLVLLLTGASPVVTLLGADISLPEGEAPAAAAAEQTLEEENLRLMKQLIEARTAAYISDKARQLGAECTAEATYAYGADGQVTLTAVTVRGALTAAQRGRLEAILAEELGVAPEDQIYEEE